MKKLKTSIAILILLVMSITGVIKPVTAYAAEIYKVRAVNYGDWGFTHALDITNESTGDTVVGYCYNAGRGWPGWRPQTVYKYGNATNQQFLDLAGTQVRYRDSLREDVMKVCYKGFPRDGKGIRDRYGLDKATFRLVTQLAVWYYTDSHTFRSPAIATTYGYMLDEQAEKAYQELITTPVTLPKDYILDLYKNNSDSEQNILSTTLREDYVPPKEYSIEFSKRAETLNGKELSGATLQILDKKDGTVLDKWTTNGSTHKSNLVAGEYTFQEITAPDGYEKVSDFNFKVDDKGTVWFTSNLNEKDQASIAGSKLTVVDKKPKIVYKSLTVKKEWELYGHKDSEIPESVKVQLYENGAPFGNQVELKKIDGWKHTWDQLDSSKTYTVDEVDTPANCEKRIGPEENGTITIYNSMKPELTIEKIVRDGEWADKTREFDFNIQFTSEDGNLITDSFDYVIEKEDGTQVTGSLEVKDGSATFKLGHSQKIKIKGLPPKVTYCVEEVSDENAPFKASYKISNQKDVENCPSVQITNDNPNNVVTVYNTFKYIVDTGIDLNNNYTVPGVLLIIAGILLFGGIAVLRFRKRLK